ncbi:nitrogen regulation protein NR(I) [Salinibius halmophilus]|uniref:nitrogen regulation protein NR(I) n=1 Tax=Salinibius halmophilus TaxID=1853216 RepID=UPI000E666B5A|nr:nitrogen regulation protein NR(I) [Salinibius halmophilus]
MQRIWVVDDDHSIRWVLDRALQKQGWQCQVFENAQEVLDALSYDKPDVLLSDVRMSGMDGLQLMEVIHQKYAELPVIIMTAHSDLDSAVQSFQGGAFEYLPKPFDLNDATELIQRALDHAKKNDVPEQTEVAPAKEIIGEAPSMQEVFRAIGRLSQSNITVLINGESGTGKELVAAALHRHSPRRQQPFVALNMAAIPKDLMESELFGHEKGAFTGATAQRQGRFEQANQGTLFLDEIGDMPAETQTRLLRVLSDGVFYRVGGTTPIKVDVRIIAATHQDLESLVRDGRFREDLFHRLNVIRIKIPALRERREDIPKLLEHFLAVAAKELDEKQKSLRSDTLSLLQRLPWPGNVRQLENTCRWLTVMASGQEVLPTDLPPELREDNAASPVQNNDWAESLRQWAQKSLMQGETGVLKHAVISMERILIETALQHTNGRKAEAAELLGWGRNTLTRKLKELDM